MSIDRSQPLEPPAPIAGADIRISVMSRVGGRERNEDACGYWGNHGNGTPLCCVLSDGAGGHGGGDVASRIAVETVLRSFAGSPARTPDELLRMITLANKEVIRGQKDGDAQRDMRATLVVLSLDPTEVQALWGHVGDSRLYCFRGGYIMSRTKDHSLVQSMIDAGFGDADRLRASPDRSVLIASLGGEDGFEPDVTAEPLKLRPGDAFLLCSDGFWEYVNDRSMEATLQRASSPDDWLAEMEKIVRTSGRPGQDNYSALAVWYGVMDFSTMTA